MIVQDHEKITFTNPGSLRITKEEAMSGGISDPRNTVIFKMFAMLNIGERAGSGLAHLQYVWSENQMNLPVLDESFSPDQTILIVPLTKDAGAVNDEAIEVSILNYIQEKGSIKSIELAQYLGCGQAWARKLLQRLLVQNLIVYQGSYRNRRYVLKHPRQDSEQ